MRRALSLVLLWPALALADAVSPPPDDCPPGSVGQTGHSGTWCEAVACDGEGSCDEGNCRPYGLCVLTEERECGGLRPDTGEPCTFTVHEALGPCSGPNDCEEGTCEVVDRCVRGGAFGAGCGCAQVPTNRVGLAVGAGLLAALAIARRWRARPTATASAPVG